MQAVRFQYNGINDRVKNARQIRSFIPLLFKKEKVALEQLNYIFCSDDFLLDINRRFLRHDYYTDIITFPLSAKGQPVHAEIYISSQRVKENAKLYGSTIETEFLRIIFHGALHLCGYGDKTKAEKAVMTQKENEYISLYNKQSAKS